MAWTSMLFDKHVMVSLAVATVCATYVYYSITTQQNENEYERGRIPAVHPGGTAIRLFFVSFLATYLLLRLVEYSSKSVGPKIEYDDVGTRGSLKEAAMRHVDTRRPDF
jgi:hypothetical protein